MAQDGYKNQWGPEGRDDLGIMRRMGANFLRLYHPMGDETGTQPDHTGFLDASHKAGLNVFAAVSQYIPCDGQDCYQSWYNAVKEGLNKGFASNKQWHPAVWAVDMINEVDGMGNEPPAQVAKLISAIDGFLQAEKEAGITDTKVNITSCFNAGIATPLGGGKQTIYHGFTTMENWMKTPSMVPYKPRSVSTNDDLAKVISSRWMHCLNNQGPWKNGLDNMLANQYPFAPRPWFLGEMGWNGQHQDAITADLEAMADFSKQNPSYIGSFAFQFQTAYQKGFGSELNFGLFGLGEKKLGYTADIQGKSFDVHCLTTKLCAFQPGTNPAPDACTTDCDHRVLPIAKNYGGGISGDGVCLNDIPLCPPKTAQEITV
jgi:hypothetical protein